MVFFSVTRIMNHSNTSFGDILGVKVKAFYSLSDYSNCQMNSKLAKASTSIDLKFVGNALDKDWIRHDPSFLLSQQTFVHEKFSFGPLCVKLIFRRNKALKRSRRFP